MGVVGQRTEMYTVGLGLVLVEVKLVICKNRTELQREAYGF
jgi:hypothetical protein